MAWQIRNAEQMDLFTSPYKHRGDNAGQRRLAEIEEDQDNYLEAPSSGDIYAIKAAFRKWDSDGNGVIDRYELMMVMRHLCHVSESDLEALMLEVDTNGDGDIDYEEFIDWLMKPATESQGKALFDYATALQPVFDAYDLHGKGAITFAEFEEVHSILKGSMRLNNLDSDSESDGEKESQKQVYDPLFLRKDADDAFKLCDSNNDKEITFREFVNWMRVWIDESEISVEQLAPLAARVGQMISSCFKQMKIVEGSKQTHVKTPVGEVEDVGDLEALQYFVSNLARTTEAFEVALKPKDYEEPTGTKWSEPPVGLSVERLKGVHMRCFPLNMRKVAKVHFSCLCVPHPDGDEEADSRIWLGEVLRKVQLKSGKTITAKPAYYIYERQRFRWVPLWNEKEVDECGFKQGAKAFLKALDNMDPELGLFCLLKTEANFGTVLPWPQILICMEAAVDIGFLEKSHALDYIAHVKDDAKKALRHEGMLQSDMSEVAINYAISEFLAKVSLRPRVVMASLSELGIVKISPVWQEFVNSD